MTTATITVPPVTMQQPVVPTATVAVDTNHDGRANVFFTGVDMNRDGIPDYLQGAPPCFGIRRTASVGAVTPPMMTSPRRAVVETASPAIAAATTSRFQVPTQATTTASAWPLRELEAAPTSAGEAYAAYRSSAIEPTSPRVPTTVGGEFTMTPVMGTSVMPQSVVSSVAYKPETPVAQGGGSIRASTSPARVAQRATSPGPSRASSALAPASHRGWQRVL